MTPHHRSWLELHSKPKIVSGKVGAAYTMKHIKENMQTDTFANVSIPAQLIENHKTILPILGETNFNHGQCSLAYSLIPQHLISFRKASPSPPHTAFYSRAPSTAPYLILENANFQNYVKRASRVSCVHLHPHTQTPTQHVTRSEED